MNRAAGIRLFIAVSAVAAALVVCGCGGDSATETASTSPSSTAAGQEGGGQGQSPSSSPSGTSKKSAAKEAADQAAAGPAPSTAAKQGAPIVAPKGPREPEATPAQRAEATIADISLSSPALAPGPESVSILPAAYTCKGKDTWPRLRWSGVPADTAELVLLVLNLEPVNEAFFFDWAVAGIDPSLEGIESGQLPKGAILGKNSFGKEGYSICPAASKETIIFALYALPASLGARRGFDPAELRKEILAASGNAGLMAVSAGG
jgi:phosphatidylethanolamine-binding protein (PEBP) family uncharacterized protein